MRPARSSAARAASSIALCLAAMSGGCGGSTAAQPTEVNLGRAPGDTGSSAAEAEKDKDGLVTRAEGDPRPAPVSKGPVAREPEPGYLTLVCDPGCDEVSHEGTSLGPSPVVHAPLAPGSRRITVSNGGVGHKIITVIIRSGEVNAMRIAMGGGGPVVLPLPVSTASVASASPAPAQPGPMSTPPITGATQMRATLEPKAWAGKATLDELKLLRAICSYMADRACRDRASALIQAQTQAPPSSSP